MNRGLAGEKIALERWRKIAANPMQGSRSWLCEAERNRQKRFLTGNELSLYASTSMFSSCRGRVKNFLSFFSFAVDAFGFARRIAVHLRGSDTLLLGRDDTLVVAVLPLWQHTVL